MQTQQKNTEEQKKMTSSTSVDSNLEFLKRQYAASISRGKSGYLSIVYSKQPITVESEKLSSPNGGSSIQAMTTLVGVTSTKEQRTSPRLMCIRYVESETEHAYTTRVRGHLDLELLLRKHHATKKKKKEMDDETKRDKMCEKENKEDEEDEDKDKDKEADAEKKEDKEDVTTHEQFLFSGSTKDKTKTTEPSNDYDSEYEERSQVSKDFHKMDLVLLPITSTCVIALPYAIVKSAFVSCLQDATCFPWLLMLEKKKVSLSSLSLSLSLSSSSSPDTAFTTILSSLPSNTKGGRGGGEEETHVGIACMFGVGRTAWYWQDATFPFASFTKIDLELFSMYEPIHQFSKALEEHYELGKRVLKNLKTLHRISPCSFVSPRPSASSELLQREAKFIATYKLLRTYMQQNEEDYTKLLSIDTTTDDSAFTKLIAEICRNNRQVAEFIDTFSASTDWLKDAHPSAPFFSESPSSSSSPSSPSLSASLASLSSLSSSSSSFSSSSSYLASSLSLSTSTSSGTTSSPTLTPAKTSTSTTASSSSTVPTPTMLFKKLTTHTNAKIVHKNVEEMINAALHVCERDILTYDGARISAEYECVLAEYNTLRLYIEDLRREVRTDKPENIQLLMTPLYMFQLTLHHLRRLNFCEQQIFLVKPDLTPPLFQRKLRLIVMKHGQPDPIRLQKSILMSVSPATQNLLSAKHNDLKQEQEQKHQQQHPHQRKPKQQNTRESAVEAEDITKPTMPILRVGRIVSMGSHAHRKYTVTERLRKKLELSRKQQQQLKQQLKQEIDKINKKKQESKEEKRDKKYTNAEEDDDDEDTEPDDTSNVTDYKRRTYRREDNVVTEGNKEEEEDEEDEEDDDNCDGYGDEEDDTTEDETPNEWMDETEDIHRDSSTSSSTSSSSSSSITYNILSPKYQKDQKEERKDKTASNKKKEQNKKKNKKKKKKKKKNKMRFDVKSIAAEVASEVCYIMWKIPPTVETLAVYVRDQRVFKSGIFNVAGFNVCVIDDLCGKHVAPEHGHANIKECSKKLAPEATMTTGYERDLALLKYLQCDPPYQPPQSIADKFRVGESQPTERARLRLSAHVCGNPKQPSPFITPRTEYVNAALIQPSKDKLWQHSRVHYISAAAPPPCAFEDFWRMVWEQRPQIIVSLASPCEGSPLERRYYPYCGTSVESESVLNIQSFISVKFHGQRQYLYSKIGGNTAGSGDSSSSNNSSNNNSTVSDRGGSSGGGGDGTDQSPKTTDWYIQYYMLKSTLLRDDQTREPDHVVCILHHSDWPQHGPPTDPQLFQNFVDDYRIIRNHVLEITSNVDFLATMCSSSSSSSSSSLSSSSSCSSSSSSSSSSSFSSSSSCSSSSSSSCSSPSSSSEKVVSSLESQDVKTLLYDETKNRDSLLNALSGSSSTYSDISLPTKKPTILVHCSSGANRALVLIAIDILLDQLEPDLIHSSKHGKKRPPISPKALIKVFDVVRFLQCHRADALTTVEHYASVFEFFSHRYR